MRAGAHNFVNDPYPIKCRCTFRAARTAFKFWLKVGEQKFYSARLGRTPRGFKIINRIQYRAKEYSDWHSFYGDTASLGIVIAPLEQGAEFFSMKV